MKISINNSSFVVRNSSFSSSTIYPTGSIFRVANVSSSTPLSLTYTDINRKQVSTGNISLGGVTYILALSGSLQNGVDSTIQDLVWSNLYINSNNPNENLNFTEELITTTGAGSWIKPAGITQVIVECIGGGGGGGGATLTDEGGSGGASGCYARSVLTYSSPQQSINYTVGTGGAGSLTTGGTGGNTFWNTNQVLAAGSTGGDANFFGNTGAPGAGSIGDVVIEGYGGGSSYQDPFSLDISMGTGGGLSDSLVSVDDYVAADIASGIAGALFLAVSQDGVNGDLYGGGGSGAVKFSGANRTGGNGNQGVIRLIYR